MKSVSFLRNTWKKWESKASDNRGNTENINPQGPSKSRSSTANNRSLTITVKHVPLEISNATPVDGSWKNSEEYQPPPSPIYDQFTQNRGDVFFSRASSQNALDVAYRLVEEQATVSPTAPAFKTLRHTSSSPRASAPVQPTVIYNNEHNLLPSSRQASPPRQTATALRSPTLPTYQLLPPIDLNYGPGSKFERRLESSGCKCVRSSPHIRHHSLCPRYKSSDAATISRTPTRTVSESRPSGNTVQAVLDLSLDSKKRSLYHNSGSTPYLPYKDENSRPTPSVCSENSDADFPLSLFPAPPPLIVRKRIPAPLTLRSVQPSSSQSSLDSTPVGTPTTPRYMPVHSPSQSSIASPTKKHFSVRPSASFSPPPFGPPNSPLPSLPVTPLEISRRPSDPRRSPGADASGRSLRLAQSTANLRDAPPYPAATHRLTSSEPISDQSSLPIKRPSAKARPEAVRGLGDLQAYMELPENVVPSPTSTDTNVQWGYAL